MVAELMLVVVVVARLVLVPGLKLLHVSHCVASGSGEIDNEMGNGCRVVSGRISRVVHSDVGKVDRS